MAYVKTVGRWVKANVEGSLSLVYHLFNLFLVRHLGNQAAGNQFFINLHVFSPFLQLFS